MSDYIVSARKYRPNDFATVVGQDAITRTLDNAIKNDQLAHAYLFCGPRGVGKTSCARIFAKAINKESQEDDRDFAFNIFELDAASNNKVDDIRQLIDQVRIQPQVGKYKVYIIDEVHMLTAQAFNAFLKTLEEPPSHAIFILATTEKHKILPTILSRCQIYDFNRIAIADIAKHLAFVAQAEGVSADQEALFLIAQKADGALRDALSIFDQIVSFNGKNITYEKVLENLNILDFEFYFRLTELIRSNDRSGIFLIVEEILANGFELKTFMSGAAKHFRDLMVCKDQATVQLLDVSQGMKEKYYQQSLEIEEKHLLNALHFINEAELQMKGSSNQRILVELSLMKIANMFGAPKEKKTPDLSNLSDERGEKSPKKFSNETADDSLKSTNAAEMNERESLEIEAAREAGQAEEKKIEVKSEALSKSEKVEDSSVANEESISEKAILEELNQSESILAEPKAELKRRIKRSANSISILTNQEEEKTQVENEAEREGVEEETTEISKKELSLTALMQAWKDYAEILKQDAKFNLHAFFQDTDPKLEENVVLVAVQNKIIESALNEIKQDLLGHLKKTLKNPQVELRIIQDFERKENYSVQSPTEKFKAMTAANPLLGQLREQLDLGIE